MEWYKDELRPRWSTDSVRFQGAYQKFLNENWLLDYMIKKS